MTDHLPMYARQERIKGTDRLYRDARRWQADLAALEQVERLLIENPSAFDRLKPRDRWRLNAALRRSSGVAD